MGPSVLGRILEYCSVVPVLTDTCPERPRVRHHHQVPSLHNLERFINYYRTNPEDAEGNVSTGGVPLSHPHPCSQTQPYPSPSYHHPCPSPITPHCCIQTQPFPSHPKLCPVLYPHPCSQKLPLPPSPNPIHHPMPYSLQSPRLFGSRKVTLQSVHLLQPCRRTILCSGGSRICPKGRQNFPENCMKLKKIRSRWWGVSLDPPLLLVIIYCVTNEITRRFDCWDDLRTITILCLFTLGPAYNEQKDAKETARYKWVLVVTKLFNMVVNDFFDAKQSARYSRVLVVTELVLSGPSVLCILVCDNEWLISMLGEKNQFSVEIFPLDFSHSGYLSFDEV